MAIEMRVIGARLDFSCSTDIKAHLEVIGSEARIRIDLPSWEWVEVAVPVQSVMEELRIPVE